MKKRISICVHTHKDGTVSVDIGIPKDIFNQECEIETKSNNKAKKRKATDPGYETDQRVKRWYDRENEGRIYDNLD